MTEKTPSEDTALAQRQAEIEPFKDAEGNYRFRLEVFENPNGTLSAFVQEFPGRFMHFKTKTLAPAREIRRFMKDLLEEHLPDGANIDVIPAGYEDAGENVEQQQDDDDTLGIPGCLVHAVRVRPELKNKIPKDLDLKLKQKLEKKRKLTPPTPRAPQAALRRPMSRFG